MFSWTFFSSESLFGSLQGPLLFYSDCSSSSCLSFFFTKGTESLSGTNKFQFPLIKFCTKLLFCILGQHEYKMKQTLLIINLDDFIRLIAVSSHWEGMQEHVQTFMSESVLNFFLPIQNVSQADMLFCLSDCMNLLYLPSIVIWMTEIG
jgi:hypothetical protein